jgi:hypothetical protein
MRRDPHVVIVAFLCALAVARMANAQSGSSTLLGTLTDPGDAVVPNATVTVTEVATGRTYSAHSNESGLFRFLNLLPGQYSLRVQPSGFKAFELNNIILASSEVRDLGKLINPDLCANYTGNEHATAGERGVEGAWPRAVGFGLAS